MRLSGCSTKRVHQERSVWGLSRDVRSDVLGRARRTFICPGLRSCVTTAGLVTVWAGLTTEHLSQMRGLIESLFDSRQATAVRMLSIYPLTMRGL